MSRRRAARIVALAALIAALGFGAWLRLGQIPPGLLDGVDAVSTLVVDRNGVPLYEARSPAGTRRVTLSPDHLPPLLVSATLAAEDRRFEWHPGIDPVALARASVRNLRAGRVIEGGSTITQQVAKLLLARRNPEQTPRRGWRAKVREGVIALRLEHRLSKQEILALYLNLAPYGNQIEGAGRAAQIYFGVGADTLTPAQAAFLAGLPQRPSGYNPYRQADAGRRRQRQILDRMAAQRRLSEDDAAVARAEGLRFAPLPATFSAPHFVEMAIAAAPRRDRIVTTLDVHLQADVEGIVRSQRASLERHGAHNVAVVVLDNRTGGWLAWEGSGNYADADHGGAINGAAALRQPGSALKPFTYALAFESGDTPATIVPDVPSTFPTAEEGVVYRPVNYDGTFHGPLRARKALAGSQNVPAVALAARIGVPDLLRLLRRVGITSLDRTAAHYGVGLTLGNAEVRLAELVAAYATFARGGVWLAPRFLEDAPVRAGERVLSQRTAFWITDVLADADARAYVFGRGGSLEFPFPVAVKTGTSQAYRDNWTIAYTHDVTVGVWVGNFDRSPLIGSTGVTGAAPILHAVLLAAQQRFGSGESHAIVERPADLGEVSVCELSGLRATTACLARRTEFLPASATENACDWHHGSEDGILTFWPGVYQAWARDRGLLAAAAPARMGRAGAPAAADAVNARRVTRFDILNPPAGATYLIDPTLRADFQTVPFRAIAGSGAVEWRVNGRVVGTAAADRDLHWSLQPGTHRIAARDALGAAAETQITVR